MKVLFLVIDGIADISHPELDWRTPLQAASTPNLDRLASEGGCALMYPLAPGICPSSETAHWSMFGYAPDEFPGRAYLHALAADLPCRNGDALFMFNLVAVERKGGGIFVLDESDVPIEDVCALWADRLSSLAPQGMSLHYMGGIEFLAVLRGGSRHVLPTDPFIHTRPVSGLRPTRGKQGDEMTAHTLGLLQDFLDGASRRLADEASPEWGALGLVMKWPSRAGEVEAFEERHGMRAAAVVSTPCFQGMGELLSMRVETVGDGKPGADLGAKLETAKALFAEGLDFVFVHTKHADEAAHRGDPALKKEVIAAMDGAFSGVLEMLDDPEVLAVITADHSTPTTPDHRVIHGGDPVPVLIHGRTVRRDGLDRFDEVSAASGGMGQLAGKDMMPLVLYLSRRAPFYTG